MIQPLYEHQDSGASWLSVRSRGYLGDEPGLGKTRTIIEALNRAGVERPLIVAPAIVRSHWGDTTASYGRGAPLIFSYDEIMRGGTGMMKRLLGLFGVGALVLDEAHYLKHATAQRTKILLGPDGYARRLPVVYLASGTPIPKHVGELWTVVASMFPEVAINHGIRTHAEWLEQFAIMRPMYVRGVRRDKVVGVKNETELNEILSAIMLRRTLDDVGLDVPMIDWQVLKLDGTEPFALVDDDNAALLEVSRYRGALEDIANEPHIARMRRRLGELKVDPVVQMLRSQLADSTEKVVVFAHHTDVLRALADGLRQFGAVRVDGGTSDAARHHALDKFQHYADCRVFIGQNQTTGTGFDGLQHAAHRAILVEPSWSNYENVQLAKRLARIGATERRVIVQMVSLAGTLDDAIVGQNLREAKMAAQVDAARERVA